MVRGLITPREVEATRTEISSIVRDMYSEFQRNGCNDGLDWDEMVNRIPAWKEGKMESLEPEMGIRRLFSVAEKNEQFANLPRHKGVG